MSRAKRPTRGGEALRNWIANSDHTQETFAVALRREGEKLRQTTVSSWIIGNFAPSTDFAVRIEELTGIPVRWWTEFLDAPHEAEARTG